MCSSNSATITASRTRGSTSVRCTWKTATVRGQWRCRPVLDAYRRSGDRRSAAEASQLLDRLQ